MRDRIVIEEISARTIIGCKDWERRERQEVRITLELETDLSAAAASDDLNDAVDYRALSDMVVGHTEESRFRLLEALAGSVADLVLEHYPAVVALDVRVAKPRALPFARNVSVTLHRER